MEIKNHIESHLKIKNKQKATRAASTPPNKSQNRCLYKNRRNLMISGNKFFSLIPSNRTVISTGNNVVDSFAFGPGVHALIL